METSTRNNIPTFGPSNPGSRVPHINPGAPTRRSSRAPHRSRSPSISRIGSRSRRQASSTGKNEKKPENSSDNQVKHGAGDQVAPSAANNNKSKAKSPAKKPSSPKKRKAGAKPKKVIGKKGPRRNAFSGAAKKLQKKRKF